MVVLSEKTKREMAAGRRHLERNHMSEAETVESPRVPEPEPEGKPQIRTFISDEPLEIQKEPSAKAVELPPVVSEPVPSAPASQIDIDDLLNMGSTPAPRGGNPDKNKKQK